MRRCDVRSLIACLTLLFLLGDVSAQTGQPLLRSSTELNRSSQRSTAVTQTGSAATAPALGDSQGRLPDSLVAALALAAAAGAHGGRTAGDPDAAGESGRDPP